ncbi:hypothetical protein [Gordonia lacunae]|uniref:hypothetical protein n=1 Tax=Gordonia lacunae TaxID=417102 RepID=UPI003CC56CCA
MSADAALGGVAAAWWLGLHPTEPRKHLLFTASRGVHGRSSATAVIRHRHLDDIALLDSALLSGTVKLGDLQAAHSRYPRQHGSPALTQYLRLLGDGARSEA